jgi:hypothetical protein
VACDIDGVLADVRRYVEEYLLDKNDWNAYFEHTLDFPPILSMVNLLCLLRGIPGNEICLVTSRPESNRELTEKWLTDTLLFSVPAWKLLMRPNDDLRSAFEIKLDWFRKLLPDLVIEDDPEVVDSATKEGFLVLQVHGFRATKNDLIPFIGVRDV